MAFTATVIDTTVFGDKRVVIGSYANTGGSTGGDVVTGLGVVQCLMIQPFTTAVASMAVVNETVPTALVPLVGISPTIVTNANESGMWMAYGW